MELFEEGALFKTAKKNHFNSKIRILSQSICLFVTHYTQICLVVSPIAWRATFFDETLFLEIKFTHQMTLIQANKSHTSLLNSCRLNCPGTPLFCHTRGGCSPRPRHQSRTLVRSSKDGEEEEGSRKGNFGDEMLDFMYAGKKLRKWYGEEGMVLPRDGGDQPNNSNNNRDNDDEVGDGSVRDTI